MKTWAILGLLTLATAARGQLLPTGQEVTPANAPDAIFLPLNPGLKDYPDFTAGQAAAMALSPDGRTLLILTSGFNRNYLADNAFAPGASDEYVFVYDVSGPRPIQRQAVHVPNTFLGVAWAPKGDRFFVSGGVDDTVREYLLGPPQRGYFPGRAFFLRHGAGNGLAVKPEAAGLAVSPDGKTVIVANLQNDSVSVIDLESGKITDRDLRPGKVDPAQKGVAGGEAPRAVAFVNNKLVYVASQRDRELVQLTLKDGAAKVGRRVKLPGQPNSLAMGPKGRLYAAMDNTDAVAVVDADDAKVIEIIPTGGATDEALKPLGGAGANALALAPDGKSLWVSNGGENAVARIDLGAGGKPSHVAGLVATGWYPTSVAVSRDGKRVFVANAKSPTGPNPLNCRVNTGIDAHHDDACRAANQYNWQIEKAGFLTFSTPSDSELPKLTAQVASNNRWGESLNAEDQAKLAFLKSHIHHVIYIVKENRTYDQMLGDLEVGNGDPKLAIFGKAMTPNQHQLARQFVDLDNFYDSGESSNTGWNWTVAGRTNDYTEREAPVNYADRGLQYDQEGPNRNINVGFANTKDRIAANPMTPKDNDDLPGTADMAAPDGPGGTEGQGYLWDQALKAGLSVRNWGFYGDLTRYAKAVGPYRIPRLREPFKEGKAVFTPAKASLMGISDLYFRGFDQGFPDYWRFKEWEREFDGFVAKGEAPNLMLVRLPHDHTGDFDEGIDGINTVEAELADNDYAVGLLVEKVAKSPFAKDTLIAIIEDDSQDGPDHVDSHRSIAFLVGPYVKQGAVVSHRYHTVDMVKTMESVLGFGPMGLNDALARPMVEAFDTSKADWTFTAIVPGYLRATTLPLPPATTAEAACPAHSPDYWRTAMKGQDFRAEDRLDTAKFNAALWRGFKGDAPYPDARTGEDLSKDRAKLLTASQEPCA
jgi:DNA-binding beta-propeller fold protein YncE